MDTDYPAAHSMDTCFFAVDRDGHVALFDTGEAGAVPNQAYGGDAGWGLREQLAQLGNPSEVQESLQGRLRPGREIDEEHLHEPSHDWQRLMFLRSTDLVQEAIAKGDARKVPSVQGEALIVERMSPELFERLHNEKVCLGCFYHFGNFDEEEGRVSPASCGVFEYHHLTENWISGPYGCDRVPTIPMHVDQLPPRVRAQVKQMTFEELCFVETPYIQPVEHVPCASWENQYMDVTGQHVQPMPGMEDFGDDDIIF